MIFLFVLLLTVFNICSSYKVLVYNPAFGASHSNFLGKISDILIDAGHDVTMIIPVIMKSKSNLVGSKKVKKIIRIGQDPRNAEAEITIEGVLKRKIWTMNSDISEFFSMASTFNTGSGNQCEYIFQQTETLEFLKDEHFDLGLAEASFICGFGVYSGIPDQMSFLERFKNMAGMAISLWFLNSRHSNELRQITKVYKGSQYPDDLLGRIAFNMINSNQYLDYATPVLPKTVFIGGMQVNMKNTGKVWLSKEWEDTLNERPTNVLVSFGSNAFSSDMPNEFKSAFLQVFASMPNTTFIWKYEVENSTIVDYLPNVKLSTWMPQNDLLADDRLSLFVTHGGLGSTMELAYQGKPAVVIPLMSDQPRNAHMLTRHGGALQLDKTKLSDPDEIKKAIETVLNDSNYAKNALKLAQILESQPNQPKDVVLKHCDFAVKFGPLETLNSSGRHLNILQYYNIDIFIILTFVLFVSVSVVSKLLIFVMKGFVRISVKSKKE